MPTWTIRRLRLWEEYFLAWDGTSIASRVEMETGGMGLEGPGDFTNQVGDIRPYMVCDETVTIYRQKGVELLRQICSMSRKQLCGCLMTRQKIV